MKKFIENIKESKKLRVLSILIIGVLFLLVTRLTYAYLAPVVSSPQTTDIGGSADLVDDFKFVFGDPLNVDATPTTLPENGENFVTSTTATAKLRANSTNNTADYTYYLYLLIDTNTFVYTDEQTPEVLLSVYDPNGNEVKEIDNLTYVTQNGVSGFDITTKTGLFTLASNYEIKSTSSTKYTEQEWIIAITYLNLDFDQSVNFGNNLTTIISIQKLGTPNINSVSLTSTEDSITASVNATAAATSITKYYYSLNDAAYIETTDNPYTFQNLNSGTNYKVSVKVLNSDGKESSVLSNAVDTKNKIVTLANYVKSLYTGTQGSNGIYLHNGTIKSGTTVIDANDGSYRYAGAHDDVDNYVCYGSNASTCLDDNLYRIIGVFGDQVKLIKADYANSNLLGTSGAYNSSTYSASDYSNYKGSLTTINTYYWESQSDLANEWSGSALNTTNLNGTYLTNLGTTWTNKIATTTWKVGGNTYANIAATTPTNAYQNEIVSPAESTTVSKKIGLMHVSDYGYAASPTYWTCPGYSSSGSASDYRTSINANWMYVGLEEWTISRASDTPCDVFSVKDTEYISTGDAGMGMAFAVRPVFYLISSVNCVSGTGTQSDPYRIA